MKILMHAKSDPGNLRECNEDYCELDQENQLVVMCDGMGGHRAGAIASQLGAHTFTTCYRSSHSELHPLIASDLDPSLQEFAAAAVSSVRLANLRIFQRSNSDTQLRGMGTTISAAVFRDNTACICHVGDSRVYRLRGSELKQLTEDHTWVNELIKDNEIREDDPFYEEKRHVLTRALGISDATKIDVIIDPVRKNDIYIFCTDGLSNALSADIIREIVQAGADDLEVSCGTLVESAKRIDGSDNISVALVRIVKRDKPKSKFKHSRTTLLRENEKTLSVERKFLQNQFNGRPSRSPVVLGFLSLLLLILITSFLWDRFSIRDIVDQWPLFDKKTHTEDRVVHDASGDPDIRFSTEQGKNDVPEIKNVSQFQSSSLSNSSGDSGIVYLLGIEKMPRVSKAHVLLNGEEIGKLDEYRDQGIRMPPGENAIQIIDDHGDLLFELTNMVLLKGGVKAIELQ
ncbi:MAG: protein phosphatase 2C domain-containing protein [candidate division KSB1 bacterium]|jgi:protein phosphatase|nr:protein phosphatase 2C domain-containing protein [candidate division KSB1 bacterium]